jgi:hypothetical protein
VEHSYDGIVVKEVHALVRAVPGLGGVVADDQVERRRLQRAQLLERAGQILLIALAVLTDWRSSSESIVASGDDVSPDIVGDALGSISELHAPSATIIDSTSHRTAPRPPPRSHM